jgi:hypothetical protein
VAQTQESTQNELERRHRAALTTVVAMGALTFLLAALALAGDVLDLTATRLFTPSFYSVWSLRALMLFLALGAVYFRRARFNAARLRDIAGLGGTFALLATLQNTTRLVALIAGAVAGLGFVVFTMTQDALDVVRFVVVAAAVLFYAYPRLSAWRKVVVATRGESDAADDDAPPSKGTIAW